MTGPQLYLLIAPLVLLALASAYVLWWVRQAPKDPTREPSKHGKAG